MCGIIGYIGNRQAVPVLLEGLRRLEYRGYDSAGLAVLEGRRLHIRRAVGKLARLEECVYEDPPRGTVGIGHTRWATHGRPSEVNAHPHTDASRRIAVVHNGIVENYAELRRELEAAGVRLVSETDTELIAQLLGLAAGPLEERVRAVAPRLKGQYAVVALTTDEPGALVAFRNGPPLVIGLGEEETLVASDIAAVLARTRRVVVLEQGDVARITRERVEIRDGRGQPVQRHEEVLDWDPGQIEKGGYRHFMLKEIHEQPDAVRNTVLAYLDPDRTEVALGEAGLDRDRLTRVSRVHLVACGTSWHAALVGSRYIETLAGIPTTVEYGSEYRYRDPLVDREVMVVGVSQSGETADTLAAMELARERGALLTAICNVRGSTAWRTATGRILTQAGPEIGVASTKAFTTQLVALLMLALAMRQTRADGDPDPAVSRVLAALQRLPAAMAAALEMAEACVDRATEPLLAATSALYLGRGLLYPIALEGALKLKEISYVHAEGYPAGEMKHGPIALVTERFPVVALAARTPLRDKMIANLLEVRARGATVIAVAEEDAEEVAGVADLILPVPSLAERLLLPIVSVIPLQLLAYRVAVELGHDVDQPRNLAKSVTVE